MREEKCENAGHTQKNIHLQHLLGAVSTFAFLVENIQKSLARGAQHHTNPSSFLYINNFFQESK